jgi:hypothetical protein
MRTCKIYIGSYRINTRLKHCYKLWEFCENVEGQQGKRRRIFRFIFVFRQDTAKGKREWDKSTSPTLSLSTPSILLGHEYWLLCAKKKAMNNPTGGIPRAVKYIHMSHRTEFVFGDICFFHCYWHVYPWCASSHPVSKIVLNGREVIWLRPEQRLLWLEPHLGIIWNFSAKYNPTCWSTLCRYMTPWIFLYENDESVISGFRRDVDEICNLLGYYAAQSGSYLPKFRVNLWRWDRYVVPKRRKRITTRRCIISQKSPHLENDKVLNMSIKLIKFDFPVFHETNSFIVVCTRTHSVTQP